MEAFRDGDFLRSVLQYGAIRFRGSYVAKFHQPAVWSRPAMTDGPTSAHRDIDEDTSFRRSR